MKKTRIDFDADNEPFARLVHEAAEYQRAMREGDVARAAGAMHRVESAAEELTDEALLAADEEMSRPQIAAGMGLVGDWAHKGLAYRITRARRRLAENTHTEEDR